MNIASRRVRCVETGEIFPSIHAACRKYNISPSNLCTYLRYKMKGKRSGYHWETVEFTPKPIIICVETGEKFANQQEAADKYGVPRSTIAMSLKRQRPIQQGYSFRYSPGQE